VAASRPTTVTVGYELAILFVYVTVYRLRCLAGVFYVDCKSATQLAVSSYSASSVVVDSAAAAGTGIAAVGGANR